MTPTLNVGDYIIIQKQKDYKVGDIVTYRRGKYLLTHRIVKMDSSNVMIINDTRTIASFDPAASFLNIYDYLATFNDDVSTSSVGSRTNWLNNGFSYWLSGDANSDRYVVLNVGGLKVDNFGKKYFYRTSCIFRFVWKRFS